MSKPEPKPIKTPTLTELRKLAKRKGLRLVLDRGKMDCYTEGPLSGIACCAHYSSRDCWSTLSAAQAKRVLFAALSALPDKKETK